MHGLLCAYLVMCTIRYAVQYTVLLGGLYHLLQILVVQMLLSNYKWHLLDLFVFVHTLVYHFCEETAGG